MFESSDGLLLSGLDGLFCITDVIQMSAGVTRASEIWRLPLSHDLREVQCPPRDVCKFPGPLFPWFLLGLSSCPLNPCSHSPIWGQPCRGNSPVFLISPDHPHVIFAYGPRGPVFSLRFCHPDGFLILSEPPRQASVRWGLTKIPLPRGTLCMLLGQPGRVYHQLKVHWAVV